MSKVTIKTVKRVTTVTRAVVRSAVSGRFVKSTSPKAQSKTSVKARRAA